MRRLLQCSLTSTVLVLVPLCLQGCANRVHSERIERPDEMQPPGMDNHPAEIGQALEIYALFTGAELDVGEGVRQLPGYIRLPSSYPAMTRAQAMAMLDSAMLKAGVVVTHPDTRHVVFRLKRKAHE